MDEESKMMDVELGAPLENVAVPLADPVKVALTEKVGGEDEADGKGKGKGKKEKKEQPRAVGCIPLFFKYATPVDMLYMLFGTVAAMITG